jgi:AraC-like DNA-binding protein/mannose-6-phosphate isomerase-like protein (cupin superfamily)
MLDSIYIQAKTITILRFEVLMDKYVIKIDQTGQELNRHGDAMYPMAIYDKYFYNHLLGEVPWHWHEELELIYVYEGSCKVEHVGGDTVLESGEGFFINSNVLHRLTQVGKKDCRTISFVFKAEFIGGRYDSRIYMEYLQPIISNEGLLALNFKSNTLWERQILECMKMAHEAFLNNELAYELAIHTQLTELWRLLLLHRKSLLTEKRSIHRDDARVSLLIKYIHNNCGKRLTVPELAKQVNLSEGECYRLFQRTLHVTPTEYILNHRLQLAAIKLSSEESSILDIALSLGFGNPSYFTKKFRLHYGVTPSQYRKK